MKYFLDTEFHEYKKKFLFGKPVDTIELISIGIVAEDGREYYAVCNEFDLKSSWDNEWLRENVLSPIHKELNSSMGSYHRTHHWKTTEWSYKGLKRLLKWQGKSKFQIRDEVLKFVYPKVGVHFQLLEGMPDVFNNADKDKPVFYAYYADYDWVVFCWLFGRMINLPYGFPLYCKDLKQMLDEKGNPNQKESVPKENEHNALDDAKWNKNLYDFIEKA